MTHKNLFTILYWLYVIIIIITPTSFYQGTATANIIIKAVFIILPLLVYIFDGDSYLSSISEIMNSFRPSSQISIVQQIKDSTVKFPIECLAVVKYYEFKFDSPQKLSKIAKRMSEIATQHQLNLKAVRQLSGLRVNSYQFGVQDFEVENKNGTIRKVVPTEAKLTKLADELKRPLGGTYDVNYSLVPGSSNVQYSIAATHQNVAGLGNILRSDEYAKVIERNKHGQVINLPTALGVDLHGKPCAIDLKNGPHFRLIGATGSGKSVAATTILTSLACLMSPQELEIHIIDLKMVDFTLLETQFPQVKSLSLNIEEAESSLDLILEEMTRRYEILKKSGFKNLTQYNQKITDKKDYIPQILLLVDEYSELLGSHDKPEIITKKVIRIAQLSRAAGFTLILGSQRLDSGVANPLVKANTPACFALKTSTNTDSTVAIGQTGCESLLGHGDCLLKFDDKIKRIQFCMVSDDEIKRLGKLWKSYEV